MACPGDTIILYSAQQPAVVQALLRDGVCFSRERYVKEKYGEGAALFLTVYRSFCAYARELVPPPKGAEFPYWAFGAPENADLSGGGQLLKLRVPRAQAVFFDMYDFVRLLQLKYLGRSEKERRAYARELSLRGLTCEDVMLTPFYPELRGQVVRSWRALFDHSERVRAGGDIPKPGALQAALWCLRREWLEE